ncbi:Phosphodiesterase [Fasciola hepatica]|uniref:Phosphodiesterase n=1 Tax=Fasciola hepatica TaxID=6192 RepID=A0A4E0RBN0_FASHE|nr:Phosphodiesterase [Fasciola hepatica]
MENAVNQVSRLLGPLITKDELREQVLNIAKILFPSCRTAGLIISSSRQRSIDCPVDVLLREIRNSTNGDITIKKLSNEFAKMIIDAVEGRPVTREMTFQDVRDKELVSFYLSPPKMFVEQSAQFVLVADTLPKATIHRARILREQLSVALDRIVRLEQMFAAYNEAGTLVRRRETCSRGVHEISNSSPQSENSKNLDFFQSMCAVDVAQLPTTVMKYIISETGAETGFLVLQIPGTSEFVCNFAGDKDFQEPMGIDLNDDLFTEVILSKNAVFTTDPSEEQKKTLVHILLSNSTRTGSALDDSDLSSSLGDSLNVFSLLLCPLYTQASYHLCGVVGLLNKRSSTEFNKTDEQTVQNCFKYTLTLLKCSVAYQNERVIKARTEDMLKVAGNIFTHMMDLTDLLLKIMQEAQNLTKAERCSVFLLEPETNVLVAKVLDGLPTAPNKNTIFVTQEGQKVTLPEEIRIATTQGIAGYVATTGEILNIKDAYTHPLFYRGVDEETGFHTRNILCFPIKNEKDGIVGVAQLCNKINFPYFTHADEDIAKAFSVYCCISIVHSLMYKRVQDAQHKTRLANELMMYHMQVSEEKVQWLSGCRIPPMDSLLDPPSSFSSIPRNIIIEDSTFLACLSMFEELGLIKHWRISRKTLARFILMVRRGYRDPAYHNWMHAFSVCHFVYVCGMNLPLSQNYLTDMEFFALFVASLCHDIDHRGTNNSFQLQSKSTLAALYSSEGSVLERHHFSQTICILNTKDCNVFESLTEAQYSQILDLIRDIILATDLAHHLNILPNLKHMADVGYNAQSGNHHNLLLCLLMTAADLSDQTKNWANTVQVAKLIYEEFFRQGDLEKALGHNPADSMDRERACVPSLQISFLDYIISPLYEVFERMFPEGKDFLVTINSNRVRWKRLEEKVRNGDLNGNGLEIFKHDLLNEMHFEY